MLEYKSKMEYRSLDFDSDKQIQYQELRVEMAKLYENDESLFGPVTGIAGFHCHAIKIKIENHSLNEVKKLTRYRP